MSLNITDPTAETLAEALANETGETVTQAVTVAIRERLERMQHRQKPKATAAELMEIGRRCARLLKGKPVDHGDMLYDQHGLPL